VVLEADVPRAELREVTSAKARSASPIDPVNACELVRLARPAGTDVRRRDSCSAPKGANNCDRAGGWVMFDAVVAVQWRAVAMSAAVVHCGT